MEQPQQTVQPIVPQGAQRSAQQAKEPRHAPGYSQHHVDPQPALAKGHGKVEDGYQYKKAVERICQGGAPAPQERGAQRTQQVIHQPQHCPQEPRAEEGRPLGGNFNLHQPNSRLSSPPRP